MKIGVIRGVDCLDRVLERDMEIPELETSVRKLGDRAGWRTGGERKHPDGRDVPSTEDGWGCKEHGLVSTYRDDALGGRQALVTGGSRGIGAAIAVRLASMGAALLVAADDADGMDAVATDIRAVGGTIDTLLVALRDAADIARLAKEAEDVSILVNNAAPG
jgi:hypothetical protein